MTFKLSLRTLALAATFAAALFVAGNAQAAGHENTGFYFGGGVTSIEAGDACPVDFNDPNGINAGVYSLYRNLTTDPSASTRRINLREKCEEKERGYKFFSGYRATENFGLELGYMAADGYSTSTRITTVVNGTPAYVGSVTSSSDIDLFYISVLGFYPLFENASVFGKMGVHKWNKESDVNFGGGAFDNSAKVEDDGTGILGGVGAQYDFADWPLSLRGELNHAQLKKGDKLQIFTLSLILRGL